MNSTGPVQDMRFCNWCGETKPHPHDDCEGGPESPPCPDPETGERCGICPPDLAAQATDLGIDTPGGGHDPR